MLNPAKANIAGIHIDERHSRAICAEIGWRLRAILSENCTALPPHLQSLMDRFAELDLRIESPPLAPSISLLEMVPEPA